MPRWSEVATDPTSAEAIARRAAAVRTARRPRLTDRVRYLRDLARGKRVLDIGVVGHGLESAGGPDWLHRELAAVAAYCLGVDVLEADVALLADDGYNVRQLDITRETVDDRFDVVVAAEVLEHVASAGAMFENVVSALATGGRFVLSTPNPFHVRRVWRHWRGSPAESVDHVALFAPTHVAELAERAGLVLEAYRPVWAWTPGVWGRSKDLAKRALSTVLVEDVVAGTILYECGRVPAPG